MRLRAILYVLGPESMLDQLAIAFLVADHNRSRIHFDDLPFDSEILDVHVIAMT